MLLPGLHVIVPWKSQFPDSWQVISLGEESLYPVPHER